MGFGFTGLAKANARDRQHDRCARCGEAINPPLDAPFGLLRERFDYEAIPRIPIQKGGKASDNCIIVCPKCFEIIGQDGTKELPSASLSFCGL